MGFCQMEQSVRQNRRRTQQLKSRRAQESSPDFRLYIRGQRAEMVEGYCGRCPASTISGRNPSLLMPKMEFTSDMPGGHDLLYCCGHPADSAGRRGLRLGTAFDGSRFVLHSNGYFRKLEPIMPRSSLALTTGVVFQRLGKCRLLPVTRKSAPAASAHSRKRLSGSSRDAETVWVGATRMLAERSRARKRATSWVANFR